MSLDAWIPYRSASALMLSIRTRVFWGRFFSTASYAMSISGRSLPRSKTMEPSETWPSPCFAYVSSPSPSSPISILPSSFSSSVRSRRFFGGSGGFFSPRTRTSTEMSVAPSLWTGCSSTVFEKCRPAISVAACFIRSRSHGNWLYRDSSETRVLM